MKPEFHKAFQETVDFLAGSREFGAWRHVGSSVYLDDAKDVDILVMVNDHLSITQAVEVLQLRHGWEVLGDGGYDQPAGPWISLRKGVVNLMLTTDPKWFRQYALATKVCQGLQLKDKRDRIIVCRIVRDGIAPDTARVQADEAMVRAKQKEDEEL